MQLSHPIKGKQMRRIGLIINPLAGIGGSVGLKGSDGAEIIAKAFAMGAEAQASARVRHCLDRCARVASEVCFYTFDGAMGAEVLQAAGYRYEVVGHAAGAVSTAQDTKAAAEALVRQQIELLIFAGGDGTARDIMDVVGDRLPVIGIPSGVKMHSAVYATTPSAAGDLVGRFLQAGQALPLREAEVMDIDEEAFRSNRLSASLYGYMQVPVYRNLLQSAKAGSTAGELAALDSLAGQVVKMMEPGKYYFLGPGTTLRAVAQWLGIEKTLLGVDIVKAGRLVCADASEKDLLGALDRGPAVAVVTVIGGQGHVFGRGNQQLSHRVLRRLGQEGIIVAATESKILSLGGKPLTADTGDPEMDRSLSGYVRVQTALGRSLVYPLGETVI
jgi:predicted polyphosphate/ATP-dependent NAD kinase